MRDPALSKHAAKRIRERFNVKKGEEIAFAVKYFAKAEFIYEDEGYYTFMSDNVKFVISNEGVIVTVIDTSQKREWDTVVTFKQRVQAFIKSEINRIKGTGDQEVSLVLSLKTDIIGELADRYDELGRARSLPKKLALKGRIAALEERLGEVPGDMKHVRDEVRRKINGALAHY